MKTNLLATFKYWRLLMNWYRYGSIRVPTSIVNVFFGSTKVNCLTAYVPEMPGQTYRSVWTMRKRKLPRPGNYQTNKTKFITRAPYCATVSRWTECAELRTASFANSCRTQFDCLERGAAVGFTTQPSRADFGSVEGTFL